MRIFTSTAFKGHWPVGAAAVIVAPTVEEACTLLEQAVAQHGLAQTITPDMLEEVLLDEPRAIVLLDGEY